MPNLEKQFGLAGSRPAAALPQLRVGSLFTGVGGIDLGLAWAGLETVWQVEIKPYARKVLEKHWPGVQKFEDVTKCGRHNLEPVDIITGGYPCQDHSIAGTGGGLGTPGNPTKRSGLWFEYLRIIRELRPRWVLVENVSQLLHTADGDTVLSGIEGEGYSCWPLVVGAEILGAPHERKRAWILCRRNEAELGILFEAASAEQWALPPECSAKLRAAQEIWDYWKRELAGPSREYPDRVTTPTATMIIEPDWPGARIWKTASGRPRKLMNNGSDSSMSWILEMAVRALDQHNDNLKPTPGKCEEFMGFPSGWTDLGTDGDMDAAWEKMRRGIFGPRYWRERFRALGNAAVPQIAMLLGCFIKHYESQIAIRGHAGIPEFKEANMNENHSAQHLGGVQRREEFPLAEAGHEPASPVAGNGHGVTPPPDGCDAKGQQGNGDSNLIGEAEAYLRSYLSFPDDKYFLPLALFAALEHCWDQCFDEVPYLSVGAPVKSAGKTRVLELLSFLAGEERAILVDGSITEAALYTEIDGRKTILIDESERLRNPSSPFRPILNGGYRRGQFVYRKSGGQNVKFPNFCPKVFSHIGDLYDSLRDRCIVVQMQRTMGGSRREYGRAVAQAEGNAIGERMQEAISASVDGIRKAYRQYHELYSTLAFLRDRDREIWKPLFSLCQALAPSRIPELERSAADIAALKTIPIRPVQALAEEEKKSEDKEYAERLLADSISAMGKNEKMTTGQLARLLRDLPTSPWRTYRGSGITDDASGAMMMASLLKRFGVEPRTIRVRPKGEPNSTAKGYRRADLVAGVERAGLPLGGGKGRNPVTPVAMASEVTFGPGESQGELREYPARPDRDAVEEQGFVSVGKR